VKQDSRHPETSDGESLVRWLVSPRGWTVSQTAGILVLFSAGACLLMFNVSPAVANVLAFGAYLALAGTLLLLAWQRYFKR
jgi:hypothetical protein